MTRRSLLFTTLAAPFIGQAQDKGTVYIYRLRIFEASKRRMTLKMDGDLFAYLQNGRFLVLKLPPGKHLLSDKDPVVNIELPVEAGKVLFVRAEFAQNGLFGFNTRFSVNTKETGESDMRRLKPGDRSQIVKDFS
jgi:Protein of unknown function (DUF2846)